MSALGVRCSETNYFALLSMIRPETLAVEGKRPSVERDPGEISGRTSAGINAGKPIVCGVFVVRCHQVKLSIDDDLATDLVGYLELGQDCSVVIEPEDSLVVPLAQVQLLAVETELRACSIWTMNLFFKALAVNVTPDKSIVFVVITFSIYHAKFVFHGGQPPRKARGRY